MPVGSTLRSRGLGTLIGLVAVIGGAGAVGTGAQASAPTASAAATADASRSNVAAAVASDASPTADARPSVVPSGVPVLVGAARSGSVLSFVPPTWRPDAVRLSYQWLRDGVPIEEATGTRRRVTPADIGHHLSVRITGIGKGLAAAGQDTAAVGPILGAKLSPQTPQVSGVAQVGQALTGAVRPWGPGAVRLSWQWYRDDVPIDGATATSYLLAPDDLDHAITVRVRGTSPGFEATSRSSRPTDAVAAGVLSPTPVPAYSGIAAVGRTLTALPRRWGPGTVTLHYQWFRVGAGGEVRIDGATTARYTLVAADAGARLKVQVSGSKPGFATVRTFSALTATVRPGGLSATAVSIHGQPIVGSRLAADPGTWLPQGVRITYRWFRSGAPIRTAVGSEYLLTRADVGSRITVRISGHLDGYRDLAVVSAPTATVLTRAR